LCSTVILKGKHDGSCVVLVVDEISCFTVHHVSDALADSAERQVRCQSVAMGDFWLMRVVFIVPRIDLDATRAV
jgi:hypothetical protein